MDRDWLARELERGRSIADIARQVGRHPATVGYWVNKHRLTSHHAARHAARGGIDEPHLRSLVERGLSIREIAAECSLSPSTVRHWLRRFGLTDATGSLCPAGQSSHARARVSACTAGRHIAASAQAAIAAQSAGRRASRGGAAVSKRSLVAEAGGACQLCGYAPLPWGTAIPPRRSGAEALPDRCARRHAFAREARAK